MNKNDWSCPNPDCDFHEMDPSGSDSCHDCGFLRAERKFKDKFEKLLTKWGEKIDHYDKTLQIGRCGDDDYSFAHGKYDMLEDCREELCEVLN
jgi:hypothetical protein